MSDEVTNPGPLGLPTPAEAAVCGSTDSPTAAALSASLPSTLNSQLSTFSPFPGETPRAFSAFTTFFQLGHTRSLQAVIDKLGEIPATVKKWSSKYNWTERIQSFHAGLLQQQTQIELAARQKEAAD